MRCKASVYERDDNNAARLNEAVSLGRSEPHEQSLPSAHHRQPGTPVTQASKPPLILFADDHADTRVMYADFFAASGFRVADAADGLEAVNLAKRLRPALIVLDIQMPKIDGIAALMLLRQHQITRDIPILVLTAYDFHEMEAISAGATAVCVKPCTPDSLLHEVRKLLARSRDR